MALTPSPGILAFTQEVLGTTVATNAAYVVNPQFTVLGTPQINNGNNAYPLQSGSASMEMARPMVLPPTNTYLTTGASAPTSVSLQASTNYGAVNGNAQNPCGKIDAYPPANMVKLYQQVLNLTAGSHWI